MEALDVRTEENLYNFLQKYGDNETKRELLIFWGMHPNGKFDRRLICYALDCSRLETERMLSAMVKEGLLEKQCSNDVTLYSLSRNEERRRQLLTLTALGWDRLQSMLKRFGGRESSLA